MRTFVTGMLFLALLAAALTGIMSLDGTDFAGAGMAQAPQEKEGSVLLAPFEPSPSAVVEEMLNIAGVTADDVLYDLGCGDGRIVITAARTRGTRGVGVDIDRDLIAQSRKDAQAANVSHLVQFIRDDVMKAGIGKATVVTLFLSPEANLAVRPRLLKELQPGARIVSHCHTMGEWRPDRESELEGHHVYLWTVPAQVSGTWKMEVMDKYGSSDTSIVFVQHFQVIHAVLSRGAVEVPVTTAELKGRFVRFTVQNGTASPGSVVEFTGIVDGDLITGKYRSADQTGSWTARRTRADALTGNTGSEGR